MSGSRIVFERDGVRYSAIVGNVHVCTPSVAMHVGGSTDVDVLVGPTVASVELEDVRPL
jgi:hypothetical protein